jgi:translation elongation factor EF-G
LIERNGIISERLAGTIRYLDSLEEEQRRGITMRASAIGLKHKYEPPPGKKCQEGGAQEMIIHLLDSPGHTDFSSEVSSSLQCCDGALLVVDAVEGMCARTHQVLREAHVNQLVPVLVINKVDRLCTDLCLTSSEAYLRLRNLIENVNAASAAMLTSSRYYSQAEEIQPDAQVSKASNNTERPNKQTEEEEQKEDELWTFEPQKGNVIFASALYGWGFTVPSLARTLFRNKVVPLKPMVLKPHLFGDFKYRDGKVLKWKADSGDELPMFAEFALEPLWKVYEGVAAATAAIGLKSDLFADGRASLLSSSTGVHSKHNSENSDAKITSKTPGMDLVLQAMQSGGTGNHVPKTEAEVHAILSQTGSNTEEAVLRSLLRRYRPLSDEVLDVVCEYCPSPAVASSDVRPRALAFSAPSEPSEYFLKLQQAAASCDPSSDRPAVAHVCKFMGTDRKHVRDPELHASLEDENKSDDDNLIMGLARVLCGTLRTGSEYYVMGPKHKAGCSAPKRKIRLYLLMGSDFVRVDEVPAGHLCAIYNLEDVQLKTVTLSDQPDGMPLRGFDRGIRPLVKVNVEAVDAADTDTLERGLLQLSLADAAVEVTATSKGERILACLGEIHLEQSILDLQKVYCRRKDIQLRVSDPIVEFGETTDWFADKQEDTDFQAFFDDQSPPLRQTTVPPYNEEEGLAYARHGRTRAIVSGRCAAISLRVVPLSSSVHQALQQKKIVSDDCKDDLLRIGRALQCYEKPLQESGSNNNVPPFNMTAEAVLSILCDSLCAIDGNGNALVESRSLAQGLTVKGVESDVGQVFIPSVSENENDSTEDDDDDENEEKQEDGAISHYSCADEYSVVRGRIRKFGLLSPTKVEDGNVETSSVDAAALKIWKSNLSSAVAGFQLAVRAGPICEEPVRNVMVVLEGFEVAVVPKQEQSSADSNGNSDEYECAKTLSSGIVMSAIRSGVRCSLL